MNYLWGGMILVGVVYAAMTGNLGAVTDQALASAKEAVSLCLTMTGAMAFWVGLMKIAEKGGMVNRAASAMGPIRSSLRGRSSSWEGFVMLADISEVDHIYIVCGLCSGYFYPHLLQRG